jgi:hypothetical protein
VARQTRPVFQELRAIDAERGDAATIKLRHCPIL